MAKLLSGYVFLATVVFILGCGGDKNLVVNGGFEAVLSGVDEPEVWHATRLPETADHVVFELDHEQKHSGERSVSIIVRETHPNRRISYNWTQAVGGYNIGATYELSGWVRTKDLNKTAWIVAQCWNEQKTDMINFATSQRAYIFKGSSDWTLVKTTFTVPEGTGEVRIRAGISTPENIGGKVWFDDIKVSKS